MSYQGGPGHPQQPPGEGPTRPVHPDDPGHGRRRMKPGPDEWSPEPWANPSGRRADDPSQQTMLLSVVTANEGPASGGGGSNTGHVYFTVKFEPRPPSYTAKIVAIYGLTLVVHVVLSFVYGLTPALLGDPFWKLPTFLLAAFLLPAVSGVLVDHPESEWAKRWMYLVYLCATFSWVGVLGYVSNLLF